MKLIRRGDVWRLKQMGGDVVVALISNGDRPEDESLRTYTGMVVGGNHPSYPPYGYDICVFAADILEHGEKVEM